MRSRLSYALAVRVSPLADLCRIASEVPSELGLTPVRLARDPQSFSRGCPAAFTSFGYSVALHVCNLSQHGNDYLSRPLSDLTKAMDGHNHPSIQQGTHRRLHVESVAA